MAIKPNDAGARWGDTSADFRLTCLGGAYYQAVIILLVLLMSARVSDSRPWSLALAIAFGVVMVAAAQIGAARFAVTLCAHPRPLTAVMRVIAAVVVLLLLVPWIGGKLAGYAIQSSAMGGHRCVHLDRAPAATGRHEPASTAAPPRMRILAVDGDH